MAHSLSANKRIRQNEKRNERNRWRLRIMRDAVKAFMDKIAHGTLEDCLKAFRDASKVVDRTAGKGVIHKNQAARRKSRLNARLKTRVVSGAAAGTKSAAKKAVKKA